MGTNAKPKNLSEEVDEYSEEDYLSEYESDADTPEEMVEGILIIYLNSDYQLKKDKSCQKKLISQTKADLQSKSELRDSLIAFYGQYYNEMSEVLESEMMAEFPNPDDQEAVIAGMEFTQLIFANGCDESEYGIALDGFWDPEEGIGVKVKDGKIVRTGFAIEAYDFEEVW